MCDRCVARSDHHCPWIWNSGSNNHRQFLMFVTTLVTGIILFDYLTYDFYASATAPDNIAADCSPIFCVPAAIDSYLLLVSLWSTLQLPWTSVLLVTQFWHVARQLTILEVSNLDRYGSMGGRSGLAAGSGATGIQMGHRHHHAVNNDRGDEESGGEGEPKHRHHRVGLCKALSAPGTCGAFLLNLVGLDRFTRGRAAHGSGFLLLVPGIRSTLGWSAIVETSGRWGRKWGWIMDRYTMYLLKDSRRGKGREMPNGANFERDHDGGSRSKSLLAKLGLRMATSSSRRGYERLNQV
ncbi:hypothetical protein BKA82DRAFT_2588959 [Pisolithus tinctorius]|nr:hypothetical protein BKA82DRAFT_2588959 [Pisolithus tinctorius]